MTNQEPSKRMPSTHDRSGPALLSRPWRWLKKAGQAYLPKRFFPPPNFEDTEGYARHFGAHIQYLMDIDPASKWFPAQFQQKFGGFHPPDSPRTLSHCFLGDRVRSDLLTLLLREITVNHVPGAMAELGVHRGVSAHLLHHYCPERRLYLFDTFSGFSAADFAEESMKVEYNQKQQFTDTDVATVLRTIAPLNDQIVMVAGWFPASVTPAVEKESFAFVHLDADLEAPTVAGLDFFWSRLSAGGFIVVHDYNSWPGARLAVDRFRAQTRVAAVPMPDKSGSIVLAKTGDFMPSGKNL